MKNIELLLTGVDVSAIYWNLLKNPLLWNQHTGRTDNPESPHHGLDDIWVRFGDQERIKDNAPHDAFWYPSAEVLGVKRLCLDLMHHVGGVELGGVLITRIPPGATCKPHEDHGWHAKRYEKFAVQIASAPGQAFCFEDESLETKPGDVYWFDNSNMHWVINDTPYERVTMICCIRREH